jgi:hypothetical protein
MDGVERCRHDDNDCKSREAVRILMRGYMFAVKYGHSVLA